MYLLSASESPPVSQARGPRGRSLVSVLRSPRPLTNAPPPSSAALACRGRRN